ncbi:PVC-type heme-binding CxxCH protein [Alienimonas chondri]|uniref:Cytochrome c domain-containing protein n=1 Tax=Alienimonas chondri TaxID=2681879 RepID=A0ABX1VIT3_9PLAN|nr:PVC-type heme-binding CxxCH protein [Alienimonas chondri]NNJ28047.1 hypothetical protein [Alienimonas chondri]
MTAAPLAVLLAAAFAAEPVDPAETEGPSPAQIAATLVVAPGLTVELAAAEPLIVDPVALRFDERGRAWVVEMGDYPTPPPEGFSEENPPRGRVRILEDEDGDGTFDTAMTFADRLLFPTGLQPWKGGTFVTLAGRVSYFPDETGPEGTPDGTADREDVWFAGFAEENEQLRANHPTLGPDGWVYVANGLRGGKIVLGEANPSAAKQADDAPLDLSGRTFAFNPHTGEAKVVAGAGQYGLSIDAFGNRFFCENRKPVRHAVLPDSLTALNPHLAVESAVHDVAAWGPDSKLYPTQKAFTTSLAHAGQFTAACGVLNVPMFAPPWAVCDPVAYVCEPTAGIVHREVLRSDGATFTSKPAREGVEFLTSTSPWFRPVDLAIGPDGSLYVVDMARAVIEHPHWMPEELKNRPDLRYGETRGRLWRVRTENQSYQQFGTETGKPLVEADLSELVEALHRTHQTAITAIRILHERRDPQAHLWIRDMNSVYWNDEGLSYGLAYLAAVGALTERDVLHGIRELPGRTARLAAESGVLTPKVRAAIFEVLREEGAYFGDVAFDLCVALAPHADDPAVFEALVKAAVRSDDPYLHTAVLAGAGRAGQPTPLTAALWLSETPVPLDLLERSAEVAGRRGEVTATMGMAVGSALADRVVSDKAAAVLRGLDRGTGPALRREFAALEPNYRETLAAAFKQRVTRSESRAEDLFLLALLKETWPNLAEIAASDADPAVRVAAVRRLARTESEAAAGLVARLPAETPAVRAALIDLALTAPDRSAALLTLVEEQELTAAAVGPAATRRLLKSKDEALRERAEAALSGGSADRAEVLEHYQSVLKIEGDVARGRAAFTRACATCHAVDGVGTAVGADISDTYNRTPESLLTNILDPNKAVDVGGFAYTVLTADGRVLTGLLTSETAGSISLQSPGGETVTLPRTEVIELQSEGVSLMPVGLEEQLTPQQMADLLAFLKGWRYEE